MLCSVNTSIRKVAENSRTNHHNILSERRVDDATMMKGGSRKCDG